MKPPSNKARRIIIVAGMPRAATTFLYHTLSGHPSVWVPPRKEVEYFSLNHHRGPGWYLSFFNGVDEATVGFDISPIYFMHDEVPERISSWNPDAKVVLLIRDPVEFVLSFFANRRGAGHQHLDFDDFLSGHGYTKDGQTVEFAFDDGRIEETIERYCSAFGENLLLLSYELVREDPLQVLNAIEAFAGIPSHFDCDNFENVRINASDQRNIVWLNRLMHTKWFVDLVVRLVPKSLILRARYWVQTRRTSSENRTDSEDNTNRAIAEERLKGDRRFVSELFAESAMLTGTREAVTPGSLRRQARD